MEEKWSKFKNLLDLATRNLSQAFYDQYVETNVRFRSKSGLRTIIYRAELGNCCNWCKDLAGTYTYENAPKDVFARHANCKCIVTTKTQKGTWQDAWSRKEYNSFRESRVAREKEIADELANSTDFFVGLNGKALKAEYRSWIGKNKMKEYMSKAESQECKNYIRADFRKTSFIGDGSTADIRKFEICTGIKCGRNGNDHSQKVRDLLIFVNRILLNDIPENDKVFLEDMKGRLLEVSK